jgi:hypothetical protein
MRQIVEFQCEKCGSRYKTEAEAIECESHHKIPKISVLVITKMMFFPT